MLTLEGVHVDVAGPEDMAHVRNAGGSQGVRARQYAPHHVAHLK
jgi:hypothetical protein